jgi:hypothetical protein
MSIIERKKAEQPSKKVWLREGGKSNLIEINETEKKYNTEVLQNQKLIL